MENTHVLVQIAELERIEKSDSKFPEQHIVAYVHKFAPKISLTREAAEANAKAIAKEYMIIGMDKDEKFWFKLGIKAAYTHLLHLKHQP